MESGRRFAIYFAISALFSNDYCVTLGLSDSLVNVAFGKPANQSSNYSGRNHFGKDGFTYTASLAVDGNNSTNFNSDSCSHTYQDHMGPIWWEVDLKDPYLIKKIKIFPINDTRFSVCNYESEIRGKLENDEYMSLGLLKELYSTIVTINITTTYRFKAIRIEYTNNKTDAYICLCEVEVFAAITCPVPTLDSMNSIYNFIPGVDGNFSYNSQIVISCKMGYQVNGSPSIQCIITSRWSQEIGKCEAITCPVPTLDSRNSIYNFIPGVDGNFSYNSQIVNRCKMGYQVNGSPSIQCLITSRWSQEIGKCEVIICPRPTLDTRNSTYTFTAGIDGNYSYNSNIDIRCKLGYQLIGSPSTRCLNTSQWNEELGKCKVITCPVPAMDSRTSMYIFFMGIDGNFSYNSKMMMICKFGYQLIGNPSIRCLNTSQWNEDLGKCQEIICPVPTLDSRNSTYTFTPGVDGNYSYNSNIRIRCKLGYQLIGSPSTRCLNTRQWNEELGKCKAITCPMPTLDSRNTIYNFIPGVDGNFSYNSQIVISCKMGYQVNGSPSIQCLITSRWSQEIGKCEVITCPRPTLDSRNSTYTFTPGVDGNYSYNSNIDIRCKLGYQLIGSPSTRCLNTSQWNEELGKCKAIICPVPTLDSRNSTYTFTPGVDGNYSYNSNIRIRCKLGYQLIGSPSTQCLNTSQWNEELGKCKAITCQVPTLNSRNRTYNFIPGINGNFSYDSKIVISCKSGYQLNGSSLVNCLNTSQWSQEIGNCEEIPEAMKTVGSGYDVAGIAGGLFVAVFLVVVGVIIGVIVRKRKMKLIDKTVDGSFEDLSISTAKTIRIPTEQNTGETVIYDEPIELNDCVQTKSEAKGQNEYMNISENSTEYYSNLPDKAAETSILLEDLSSFFLSRKMDPQLFEEEYNKLTRGLTVRHDAALLPENRTKNRYKDIYPYDDTRVQLEIWDPATETDYINACYVNGFKTTHAYIAAQGPAIKTLNDFWRMIWQTKSPKIVMLSNLVEDGMHKCEKYWPSDGTMEFGEISVGLVQCETFSDFTIRTLELKRIKIQENGKSNIEQRCLKQFHFTAWPDKSVPRYATSLVHFCRKVRNTKVHEVTSGPMVVHCSAGIGRTGTFLALDYLVDQAEELGSINVFSCVETLRKQRTSLVQNAEQYMFLHEALVEALTCNTSVLSVTEFHEAYNNLQEFDAKTRKRKIDLEFEKLYLYAADANEDVYETGKSTVNRLKNRYSNVLPDNKHCPFLNVYVQGGDTYINAVFLPAYKENDNFIVTQAPLENTKLDFWRMVYQFDVRSIVMLNTLSQLKDEERYWPEDEEALELPPFRITLESKSSDDINTKYTFRLRYHEDILKVHLSRSNYWTDEEPLPKSPLAMVKQIELIQSWQMETGNKPIIVHCMNGAERSGLFCVVAALIERMKIEHDVAVEQMIKQMRSRRPQFIPSVDQFKFCYDAIQTYLEQYDIYSNFSLP